jgi:hypothetical protein
VSKNTDWGFVKVKSQRGNLSTLSTDAASKLNVLGHDGHTLGMDSAQVGILEQTNKVSLRRLLKSQNSGGLETKVGLVILSNLTNKALEWQLANQEISALLILSDLTKSDSARAVSVGLLDSLRSRGSLTSSLGSELLSGSLASGGFTSSLLGTSHLLGCVQKWELDASFLFLRAIGMFFELKIWISNFRSF